MFDREECTYKSMGSCTCLDCSKQPIVVVAPEDNTDSVCYEHNITLRNVREFIDGGILGSICHEESLMIYSQSHCNRTQIGVCAGISIDDCLNGTVKCHELTIQHQDCRQRKHYAPKQVTSINIINIINCNSTNVIPT